MPRRISLKDLIHENDLDEEVFYQTRKHAMTALFSRYPERRVYSQRRLTELWDIYTRAFSQVTGQHMRVFISFAPRVHFYLGDYPVRRRGFEALPTAEEIDDWTNYL